MLIEKELYLYVTMKKVNFAENKKKWKIVALALTLSIFVREIKNNLIYIT